MSWICILPVLETGFPQETAAFKKNTETLQSEEV